jgi:hypothetical protein
MAWIYLAESEESALHLENGFDQSPIAKSTHIVKESCYQDKFLVIYMQHLYGMMLKAFKGESLIVRLISSTLASPAKILVLLDVEKAWKESEAAYFTRSLSCVAKLSQDSSSWKTCQLSLIEEEPKWLEKLPRWGMIVDGALYPLRPLEQSIKGKDGSYWPSPDASDSTRGPTKTYNPKSKSQSGRTLTSFAGGKLSPHWVEKVMGYPSKWTELEHWAIQWFLSKRKKHLKS